MKRSAALDDSEDHYAEHAVASRRARQSSELGQASGEAASMFLGTATSRTANANAGDDGCSGCGGCGGCSGCVRRPQAPQTNADALDSNIARDLLELSLKDREILFEGTVRLRAVGLLVSAVQCTFDPP